MSVVFMIFYLFAFSWMVSMEAIVAIEAIETYKSLPSRVLLAAGDLYLFCADRVEVVSGRDELALVPNDDRTVPVVVETLGILTDDVPTIDV